MLAVQPLFEPLVAALGVIAITGQVTAGQRIGDIGQFGADRRRFVEWNLH